MFKLNKFGFPIFELPNPKEVAKSMVGVSQVNVMKTMIDAFSTFTPGHKMVEDKNLEIGDVVDYLDADGAFVCKAEILRVSKDTAQVKLIYMEKPLRVRREDLLKLVPV